MSETETIYLYVSCTKNLSPTLKPQPYPRQLDAGCSVRELELTHARGKVKFCAKCELPKSNLLRQKKRTEQDKNLKCQTIIPTQKCLAFFLYLS